MNGLVLDNDHARFAYPLRLSRGRRGMREKPNHVTVMGEHVSRRL